MSADRSRPGPVVARSLALIERALLAVPFRCRNPVLFVLGLPRSGTMLVSRSAGFEVVEITALSGFWVTFGAELAYYLQSFRRGVFARPVDALVALLNVVTARLDRGRFRDERFTWMYLVVARTPERAK